eukprot:8911504-Pyramimonas_sp.AAC.1
MSDPTLDRVWSALSAGREPTAHLPEVMWLPAETAGHCRKQRAKAAFIEVFSPPRLANAAARAGLECLGSWDLETGWDFRKASDRARAREAIRRQKPEMLFLEPPCRVFSKVWQVSKESTDPERRASAEAEGKILLGFAV